MQAKWVGHAAMYRICREVPDDQLEVEYLFDLAFAPGRHALSSYRLREGVEPLAELSFVARDDLDVLAGAIRQWPVRIGDTPALLLGPIAVHPTRQGEGLGGQLIDFAVDAARVAGWEIAVLIGDAPYYRRFGFVPVHAQGITFPPPTNPNRILGLEIMPGALRSVQGQVVRWSD